MPQATAESRYLPATVWHDKDLAKSPHEGHEGHEGHEEKQ